MGVDNRYCASWLNQFRIGPRLVSSSLLPLSLFFVFSVWLWISLGQVRDDVGVHLVKQVEQALLAKDLERDVVQVQQFLSDVSATRGQDGLDDGFAMAEKSRSHFLEGLEQLLLDAEARGITDRRQQLQTVKQDFDRFYQEGTEMAKAYVGGGPTSGNPMMAKFDSASTALQTSITKLGQSVSSDMRQEVTGVADDAQSLRISALVLCGVVIALALVFGQIITRSC